MAKPTRGWLGALRRLLRLERAAPGRHRKHRPCSRSTIPTRRSSR